MPATYENIATTTLGSAASEISFTSIPGTYTDLRIVFFVSTSTTGSNSPYLQFNSDTGTNYSNTRLQGNGTAAASARQTSQSNILLANTTLDATYPTLMEIDIFSYAGSTNKTLLYSASVDYNGSGVVQRNVGLWRNTAAITSIRLFVNSGNMSSGTTATLYGILKA